MEIEEIYSEIGNSIANSIPTGWKKAWIEAEVEDDNANFTCRFINALGVKDQFNTDFDTYQLFSELRDQFENTKGGKWDKAIFTLDSTGKFDIEFEYNEESKS